MSDIVGDLRKMAGVIAAINIEGIALEAFRKHEHIALDLNTESQLFEKGIDSTGAKIKPPYTPFTKKIKRQKGQPTNRVTLKDRGDFHRGFFAKADRFPIIFDSKDSKTEKLTFKYGEQIFGLTKQSREELTKEYTDIYIREEYQRQLSQSFRLLR